MTYEQINYGLDLLEGFEKLKVKFNATKFEKLKYDTKNYFPTIRITGLHSILRKSSELSSAECLEDCDRLISAINGLLATDKNLTVIKKIKSDIKTYKGCNSNKSIVKAIQKLYYSYCSNVKFGKVVEKTINDINEPFALNDGADKTMLDGMLNQLELYAVELCNGKSKSTNSKADKFEITFNNTNNNTLTQTTEINIEIEFENAVKQIEEACLPDVQEKEVLAKLQELKEILESKTTTRARWDKVKGFFKWVAEQVIQVASIIIPLLANAVK